MLFTKRQMYVIINILCRNVPITYDFERKKSMLDTKYSVIIPSYNPDEKLICVIRGLAEKGVSDIIVVNDGSKQECLKFFNEVKKINGVTLLSHDKNRGKGAALKTAFRFFLDNRDGFTGCVTADGDAQHKTDDIIACAEEMCADPSRVVLGVRDFSLPHVPIRSRRGNRITSLVFRIFVGMKLSDTQTGLRAFPRDVLEKMCGISGDRYEYETNMLLEMKRMHIPFSEKVIETVYIEENKTSHFNPVRDSWRIYKLILAHFFKYTLSSLLCLVLEQIIQTGIYTLLKDKLFDVITEIFAFLPARIISSIANFYINKKFVFCEKDDSKASLIRYYILWFCQAIVTMSLDWFFGSIVFATSSAVLYTIITLVIKTVIAIASFRIQKDWVFAEKIEKSREV